MELFNYLLKVSACSALFFAFYLLVLRKLTFFKINRFYLLFSVVISFIIPALQFTIEREAEAVVSPIRIENQNSNEAISEVPITVDTIQTSGTGDFNWLTLLPYLYGGIVVCLLVLTAWRVLQLLKHTKATVKEINGLKLVAKKNGFTNCSFFNYVFIDENSLTDTELAVLLAHEEVHAKQYHSVDKLTLMIAKAFLWFNPIIYLYDKALEQTHEYEADEATSQHVGTESYATLLLKLAVSKSSNPLIHNFVKSPIKQRIKMLFNSKSKNMKKLAYLLALPIGLGLIWGFTVKITTRVKPLVQQETPKQDTLAGKMVKGKVIGFERLKTGGQVLNLQVGNEILPISCYNFKDKVKIGDIISVSIGDRNFAPPPVITRTTTDAKGNKTVSIEKGSYLPSKVMGANGEIIYERPNYAFLYEANRARIAWSTIKLIEKSASGTINKIVLYNKHGFTINLNVAAQQFKSDDFKKGDSILVKFIGEKLTGAKTYTTDKMIALYSQPKKHELINKALYPKFYDENGKQKTYKWPVQQKIGKNKTKNETSAMISNSGPVKPSSAAFDLLSKLIFSAGDSTVVSKTNQTVKLFHNAKIKIDNDILEGKMIEVNNKTRMITAHDAVFTGKDKSIINAELIEYDLDKKQLKATKGFSGTIKN